MPPQARRSTTAAPVLPPGRHADFNVEAAIHDMPDNYIQCRDFNHSWRPFTASWDSKARCYETELRCTRCKTIKKRRMDSDGSILRSGYDYTDGYLIKGMGRIIGSERDALRLESIMRVLDHPNGNGKAK
jgi:hypothetical protein